MVSALVSKIGVPVLIAILSEVLGEVDNQAAKTASKALAKVDEALKTGGITPEQLAEANRHAERDLRRRAPRPVAFTQVVHGVVAGAPATKARAGSALRTTVHRSSFWRRLS